MKRMKNTLYGLLGALLLALVGCSDFTDIQPKGMNLLDKVEDLDMLLNYTFSQTPMEQMYLVNDFLPSMANVATLIANQEAGIPTINSILVTWNETGDRAGLTVGDSKYEGFYAVIGKVANPVLSNVDQASGSRATADRIKAEAYVLRAYYHYLAVNFYAKAYNPATAATDPGVPYIFEEDILTDLLRASKKYTVQEVYDFILADLKAAFDLNTLVDKPAKMRVGKAFAYAVQAKVLMSMHKYDDAYQAAENSLAINNAIYDHRPFVSTQHLIRPENCSEDLFFSWSLILFNAWSPEMNAGFEPGSILYKYGETDINMFGMYLASAAYYGMSNLPVWYMSTSYTYNTFFSTLGLTTIDMYLTQAECKLRDGDISGTMTILEKIRENRIDPTVYAVLPVSTATEAFTALKNISRCENFFTTKNYINLKRWNTEDAYKETLKKTLVGKTYTLSPDSPLWIFPFPQTATNFNENLTQNY